MSTEYPKMTLVYSDGSKRRVNADTISLKFYMRQTKGRAKGERAYKAIIPPGLGANFINDLHRALHPNAPKPKIEVEG